MPDGGCCASSKTAPYERTAYAWVVGLSIAAGLVLFFVITFVSHLDPEVAVGVAIICSLGIALLLAFLVPLAMFFYMHVCAPIVRSLGGWRQHRHERLQETKQEQERRRQQAEYERSAPQRDQAARERAAAQSAATTRARSASCSIACTPPTSASASRASSSTIS